MQPCMCMCAGVCCVSLCVGACLRALQPLPIVCSSNPHILFWVLCRSVSYLKFAQTEPLLEQLLTALPTLPPKPPQLLYTSSLLLSGYSDWLGKALDAGHCTGLMQR